MAWYGSGTGIGRGDKNPGNPRLAPAVAGSALVAFIRIFLLIGTALLSACAAPSARERLLSDGIHNIDGYSFDPASTVEERIAIIPAAALKTLMQLDRRSDYQAYMPSAAEMKMFIAYGAKLPAAHKRVMQERLVRIYFIKNFVGAGMTDFVLSKDRKVYTVVYFNAAVFTRTLSEWLTYRENSFFLPDANDIRAEIDCGKQYTALMYTLLHESAHILDYVHQLTPFVDRDFAEAQGITAQKSPFVAGVWEDYDVLASKFGITESKELHAYGLTAPVIPAARIREFYARIFLTPLVSGYAAINWAEDFADSVAFYHLTQKLNQPYTVRIVEHGREVSVHKPLESAAVQQRWKIIAGLDQIDTARVNQPYGESAKPSE